MNRIYLGLSAFICLLLILMPTAWAQESVSVTAEVDRTAISTDDTLTLTVTVAGDFQQLGEPQLPLMSGFNVTGSSRSSQFSMVNGVVTARTVFTYRLQPTASGTLTIDPISIAVNGITYQTDPITVQVTQGTAPTSPPPDQPPPERTPGDPAGQDVYVEADVDDPRPFVGQQITYRFRFYQAVNLLNQPRLDWPSFSGFWTEDLSPNNVYDQTAAGRQYRVTEVQRALFATAAGRVTIEPSTLTLPGDFISRDVVLQTEPVVVDVRPLPDGAPESFEGAVGQFTLEARVEPTTSKVNEPVILSVCASGTGNITSLPDPTADAESSLPDWRVYDAQTSTDVQQDGEVIRGQKCFERLLVPRVEGALPIPAFELSFFDPESGTYRQTRTEPVVVQVAPGQDVPAGAAPDTNGQREITLLSNDIRHIKPAPPALTTQRTPLLEQPLYWLGWVAPPLVVAGTWAWDRRRRRMSSDVAYARATRAHRRARKRLAQAQKQARDDEDLAYATVSRALTDYIGDKFNLPSAGLTRDDIRQALRAQAVTGDLDNLDNLNHLIDRTQRCLDWADSGRFAPGTAGRGATELVAEAQAVVSELERAMAT